MKIVWERLQSAGAIVLFALAYFFDSGGFVMALIPAVLIHELGHMAVLMISGASIYGLNIGFTGLRLDYGGQLSRKGRIASIAAGPLAGGIMALALVNNGTPFLRLCGGMSAVLSLFNLLPALPLDGGRLLQEITGIAVARRCSVIVAWGMVLLGILLVARLGVFSLLLMGIWLVLYQGIVR